MHFRTRALSAFFILIIVFTFSCAPKGPKPTGKKLVTTTFIAPKGKVGRPHNIVVSFSSPMVPLAAIGKSQDAGPIELSPEVKGSFHWLGTQTVSFVPKKPFPFATAFTAKIDPEVLDVAGNGIAEAPTWTFETARPKIVSSKPRDNAEGVDIKQDILLRFNQPVDPGTVAEHLKATATSSDGKDTALSVSARRPTEKEWKDEKTERDRAVIIHPARKMPMASKVSLALDETFTGVEGPLASGKVESVSFDTYDKLAVDRIPCSKDCDPSGQLEIEFNNRVVPKEVIEHITIKPEVKISNDADWRTTWVEAYGNFKPRTTYTVTIAPNVTDIHGTKLGSPYQFTYATGDYKPSFSLVGGFGVLEAHGPKEIALSSTNVDSVDIKYLSLDEERIIPMLAKGSAFNTYDKRADIQWSDERSIELGKHPNKNIVGPIGLGEGLNDNGRGVVLIDVSSPDVYSEYKGKRTYEHHRALIQVTDIGITGKFFDRGALIWTTSLKDGKPLADTAIEVRSNKNDILWEGTTDKEGLARANLPKPSDHSGDTLYVFAIRDDDFAFSTSNWNQGFSPWEFGIWKTWSDSGLTGYVFTERGIYKPGETIHLKAILRRLSDKGMSVPKGMEGTITATDNRRRKYFTKKVAISERGSADADIVLPDYVATGSSTIELRVGEDSYGNPRAFRRSITVAEYKPAEFVLKVKPKHHSYVAGDDIRAEFKADYLFGEPMKRADYDWSVFRTRSHFSPEGFDEFMFGTFDSYDDEQNRFYGLLKIAGATAGKLDDRGQASINVPTKVGSVPATTNYIIESTVTDINKSTISNRTAVTVHPGEFYIGIKTDSFIASVGKPFDASFVTVDTKGARVEGKRLDVRFLKREWESVKKKAVVGYTYESKPKDVEVGKCEVKTEDKPVSCSLTAPTSGLHIVRATASDAKGNPLKTELWIYASGAGIAGWQPDRDDRLDLIADKKSYQPGETARILIKSPFAKARALITYERAGVIAQRTMMLDGYAPSIDVPLTPAFIPNLYVSVVLVTGRVSEKVPEWGADEGRPRVKVGYIKLPVSADGKKLNVSVTPDKKKASPGDEITVALKVTDPSGKPTAGEVTVMAVDTGSLILTDYRTPDPFPTFYAEMGLGVTTSDSRIHVIGRRHYGAKGEPVGGGGGGPGEGRRTKFLTVAYWNPALAVDASGTATVKFKLPDNLTTYRIMAVAAAKDMFGSGEAEVVSSKPFMMRAALPHFMSVGDSFKAGITVHNYTDAKLSGTVTAQAGGLDLEGSEKKSFTIDPEGAEEIFFDYDAKAPGMASLSFDGSADGKSDGLGLKLPVKVVQPKEVVTTYGETLDRVEERFMRPENVFKDVGGLTIDVSSTALTGLSDASLYLINYPFECVEQKISRSFGIMTYLDIAKSLDRKVKNARSLRAKVEKTLFELYLAQRWTGGISFWPGTKPSSYLSIYALQFMVEARNRGYKIDNSVFDRSVDYATKLLRWTAKSKGMDKRYLNELKAYAVYALALANKPQASYHEKLYAVRTELSLAARAQLAMAMNMTGGARAQIDELMRSIDNSLAVTPAEAHIEQPRTIGGGMRSDRYSDAYALIALLAIKPNHPMISKVARNLLDDADHGYWANTHTTAAVLGALNEFARLREGVEPDFMAKVTMGTHELLKKKLAGRGASAEPTTISMTELMNLPADAPLVFSKDGAGRMYYSARLTYASKEKPLPPREEGFTIYKRIEHYEAEKRGDDFARGDVVRVNLEFVVPAERRYVAIEDGLPAGLEAVDFTLATAKKQLALDDQSDFYLDHVEIYGNRVLVFADRLPAGSYRFSYVAKAATKGRFSVPPAHIEEMYHPEVFGRTGTSSIEIE